MKYELELKEKAIIDIKETYFYYEEQRIGLWNCFLDTLEVYIKRVQKYLEHY